MSAARTARITEACATVVIGFAFMLYLIAGAMRWVFGAPADVVLPLYALPCHLFVVGGALLFLSRRA